MKPKLTAVPRQGEEPTKQDIAMAQIEQGWLEYRTESGKPWSPYSGAVHPWSASISEALDRGRYIVKTETRIPRWRRILRWLRGIR